MTRIADDKSYIMKTVMSEDLDKLEGLGWQSFCNEIVALDKVDSPHVIKMTELFDRKKFYVIIFEGIIKGSLSTIVKEFHS